MTSSNTSKVILSGLLPEEIASSLNLSQSFRARQIFKWIGAGISDFDKMTNLSLDLRNQLKESALLRSSKVENVLKDPDGTIKLQIRLKDGNIVETVLLTDREDRKTACVSCQAGCAMKCAFCMTGTLGLSRNLEANEIVEQFMFLEEICGKLDNIVFMGMGEPMQNLPAIRKAIALLCHKTAAPFLQNELLFLPAELSKAYMILQIMDLISVLQFPLQAPTKTCDGKSCPLQAAIL